MTRLAAHVDRRRGSFGTIPRLNVGSFRAYAALWHGRFSLFAAIID